MSFQFGAAFTAFLKNENNHFAFCPLLGALLIFLTRLTFESNFLTPMIVFHLTLQPARVKNQRFVNSEMTPAPPPPLPTNPPSVLLEDLSVWRLDSPAREIRFLIRIPLIGSKVGLG